MTSIIIGFIFGVLVVKIYDGIIYLIKREQIRERLEEFLESHEQGRDS